MSSPHAVSLALVVVLALAGLVRADVAPLDKAKVPAAVAKAAEGYAMKLEIKGYEEETDDKGKVVGYRALLSGMLNTGKELTVELEIGPAGKVVCEDEVVDRKDVPAAVTASLAASKLAKGKVVRAKKVAPKLGEKPTGWELEVEEDGKVSLARFDAAGKLTGTQARTKRAEKH